MTNTEARAFCPADKLQRLIGQGDTGDGLRMLDDLISIYPADPRLQFVKGSWLAGRGDYRAARAAMRRAVDIAPDYVIARFQLGLLELSSGEPIAAQETWGPLHSLPRDHFVRLFVEGLCHLIRDEFSDAVRCLQDGMALNRENAPMNQDMQLVIDEIRLKQNGDQTGKPVISSVDLLLQQAAFKPRKH